MTLEQIDEIKLLLEFLLIGGIGIGIITGIWLEKK